MNTFLIKSSLILVLAFTSLSISAQYLSMREERPRIEKTNKNLFQISLNQEASNGLNFKIIVNNPGQELLNVTLTDQNGKLFQDDIFYRRPKYAMDLDLVRLKDGIYTLSITTNYESYQKVFTLTTEELGTRNGQMFLDRKVEVSEDEKRTKQLNNSFER